MTRRTAEPFGVALGRAVGRAVRPVAGSALQTHIAPASLSDRALIKLALDRVGIDARWLARVLHLTPCELRRAVSAPTTLSRSNRLTLSALVGRLSINATLACELWRRTLAVMQPGTVPTHRAPDRAGVDTHNGD